MDTSTLKIGHLNKQQFKERVLSIVAERLKQIDSAGHVGDITRVEEDWDGISFEYDDPLNNVTGSGKIMFNIFE